MHGRLGRPDHVRPQQQASVVVDDGDGVAGLVAGDRGQRLIQDGDAVERPGRGLLKAIEQQDRVDRGAQVTVGVGLPRYRHHEPLRVSGQPGDVEDRLSVPVPRDRDTGRGQRRVLALQLGPQGAPGDREPLLLVALRRGRVAGRQVAVIDLLRRAEAQGVVGGGDRGRGGSRSGTPLDGQHRHRGQGRRPDRGPTPGLTPSEYHGKAEYRVCGPSFAAQRASGPGRACSCRLRSSRRLPAWQVPIPLMRSRH